MRPTFAFPEREPSGGGGSTLTSVAAAAAIVRQAASGGTRIMVGIAGAPGAGKSTFAAALVELLGPGAVLLPMDGFHMPQRRLVQLGRRDRMGAPDTFDVPAFLQVLRRVRSHDGTVLAPGFDRTVEEPVAEEIRIRPDSSIVVVEGNYLLLETGGWGTAADLLDLTFFLEVPRELRLRRLIDRHVAFGKSQDEAAAWAHGPDERNAQAIQATAPRATYRVTLT